jgi:hypothetical protein
MVNPASGLPRPYPNLDAASSAAPLDSLPSEAYTILPVGLASRLARLRLTLQVQKQTFSDADETSSEHKVRFGSWHWARVSRPFSPPVDNSLAADGRTEFCPPALLASPADSAAVCALGIGRVGLECDAPLSPATAHRTHVLRPGVRHC